MSEPRPPWLPEDPSGIEGPHDVLAADEFAVPMRNPSDIPADPIHEPHDVLAAEEFAMPTGGVSHKDGIEARTLVPTLVLTALIAFVLLRLRRR